MNLGSVAEQLLGGGSPSDTTIWPLKGVGLGVRRAEAFRELPEGDGSIRTRDLIPENWRRL